MSFRYYLVVIVAGVLIGHSVAVLAEVGHTLEAIFFFFGIVLLIYGQRLVMEEVVS